MFAEILRWIPEEDEVVPQESMMYVSSLKYILDIYVFTNGHV